MLRKLLSDCTEPSALAFLELVDDLLLSALLSFGRGIKLHHVSAEDRVVPLPNNIVLALNFELSKRWRQLILKLEVCLAHLVLEAAHVSRLFDNTDADLTLAFLDLSLRAQFNSLLLFLRLSFYLPFQDLHHLDLTRQLFVVFVEPRLLHTGFVFPLPTPVNKTQVNLPIYAFLSLFSS